MTYATGEEVIRWFEDDGLPWVQQVFKMNVRTGVLEHTGDDPCAVYFVEGFAKLVEEGRAEEL